MTSPKDGQESKTHGVQVGEKKDLSEFPFLIMPQQVDIVIYMDQHGPQPIAHDCEKKYC